MDFLFDLVVHTEEGFKRLCRFTWWSLGLSALCLSAAFALQPEYMLLDEPTNSLDADGCGRLISLLGERREKGLGAVIVTHDARLIAMADKTITVKDGGISVEG